MSGRPSPAVRFELLGPLQAWHGESRLSLGPLQQQVVLAVLLLHANRPLGREQIIDAVWGATAPAYAVNLLQKHVSGLRRVLEPARLGRAPSRLLTWTNGRYLLNVEPGGLDLEVFDRELRRGRTARAGGDLRRASEALHAATRLWRGSACDGLASPLLDAERSRLAERWISAVEERIEVDLALGSHLDLVAELRHLVTDHPLQERLRGLLMVALYRSGRQAEALSVFQDARRHLVAELGIEPGADLQKLHRQILAADPVLAAPATTNGVGGATSPQPAARTPTPAQIPHDMPYFTGRDAELDRLHTLLVGGDRGIGGATPIIALAGTAGVGKTALAVHWAHQIRDRFPDGQLYVNLRGFEPTGSAMDPVEAIRGFLDAFAVSPQLIPVSLEAQAALYRSLLAGRRVLIVLDNARDADQVRPLLPGTPGCLVVVSSRNQLTSLVAAEGAYPMAVDLLAVAEARELLARRLGRARVAAEPEAVDDITASCARLPLALSIVAARAATHPGWPLAALAADLRAARRVLDAFDGEDTVTDVRSVFSWSYQRLSVAGRRLFRLLAVHPGPEIATAAAASLAGIQAARVQPGLAELARAHLVTERVPGRFALHDLLRAYATELAQSHDDEADRRAATHRVLDHYLHTAHLADRLLNPHRDEPISLPPAQPGVTVEDLADHRRALAWFTTEHPVLLASLRNAAGFDTHVWQLAWTLAPVFEYQGHWRDWADTQGAALEAARRLADRPGQALSHRLIGRAYIRLGRYDEAHSDLRHALDRYRELGDHAGQAQTHRDLAWALDRQGRHRDALPHAQQALDLFEAAGHQTGQARALNAVGWFHAQLGDHQQALARCQQALDLQQEIGDRFGQAETWDSLGYVHNRLGQPKQATVCYEHAIELYREFGDRYNEADTLAYLGDAHRAAGDLDSARSAWQQAVTILDELGHSDAGRVRARLDEIDAGDPPGDRLPAPAGSGRPPASRQTAYGGSTRLGL